MGPSKNWADLTFSYAPGVNNFPADASMYFSGPKLGYFAGVQVYNLQVANLQGTEYSYYSNAVGATLMQGLHYQVAPQWHFMGGFLLSSARMQYKTDDEVRVANAPTSALLSRGFAPFVQYQHPWSDSVKTQADIALNPSDPASVAQWGIKAATRTRRLRSERRI